MSFPNSFISIFDAAPQPRNFVLGFISVVLIALVASCVLKFLDLPLTNNDVIRHYQISKIAAASKPPGLIVVGDSSAGNAIDVATLSRLSGLRTMNLSLTGSWGLQGSEGMIRIARQRFPDLKNVLIVQTLDIWMRPYPTDAVFELFPISEIRQRNSFDQILGYYFNLREIHWHLKALRRRPSFQIDRANDYIAQRPAKFSNGGRRAVVGKSIGNRKITDDKLAELDSLTNYCRKEQLNCILAHGPHLDVIVRNSNNYLTSVAKALLSRTDGVTLINTPIALDASEMGDTTDHVSPAAKAKVTHIYYQMIAHLLAQ